MEYLLVIQFPMSSIEDFDELIAMEDLLIDGLTNGADVDGHDMGEGEGNIFIITEDAKATFEGVRAILGKRVIWPVMRAGYRRTDKDAYTPLWPIDLREFTVA
ncbi:MAG: hypothetical protein JNM62_05950 [Flavobacteriales bacterium]|nr:hypothetical protein [Flavobacteriales bacterium]